MREKRGQQQHPPHHHHHHHLSPAPAAAVSLPPPPPLPNREMLLQPPPHRSRPPPDPNHYSGYYREDQRRQQQQQQYHQQAGSGGTASAWRFAAVASESRGAEACGAPEGAEDEEEDLEDEDSCEEEEEESTLKERVARRRGSAGAQQRRGHEHHQHQQHQQHQQQSGSGSEGTEEELSSSELTSSSSGRRGKQQVRSRRFVPAVVATPRPAHATRATATEEKSAAAREQARGDGGSDPGSLTFSDLTTTGCEEDFRWHRSASPSSQQQQQQQQQQVASGMQDSTHSSVGSKASSQETEQAVRSRSSETRHRSRRHLKPSSGSAAATGSLERARHRMKSAPPGDCCGQGGECPSCAHMLAEEHRCHLQGLLTHPHMHRYSYHGPPSCPCHQSAEPPPPYDCFRWRYLLKSPASEAEERLQRLEGEKEQLRLQVSVLTEQVEAQADKVAELEHQLASKKRELAKAEEALQLEMLARSSLETQKLELMADVADMKRRQALMERQHLEIHDRAQRSEQELAAVVMQVTEERRKLREKPPVAPRPSPGMTTSTPYTSLVLGDSPSRVLHLARGASPSPSLGSSLSATSPLRRTLSSSAAAENCLEEPPPPRTPPTSARHRVEHCGTLPRHKDAAGVSSPDLDAFRPSKKASVAFGKSFLSFRATPASSGSRSCSAPNLAETEKEIPPRDEAASPQPGAVQSKLKGIKRIFGRLKRSGSGSLDELPGEGGEFQRGGVRATAGGRLGWSRELGSGQENSTRGLDPELPLPEWDTDAVCGWLLEMGLETYVPDARRWVTSGRHLAAASNHDLEKELGMKNVFHRKKLQLAIAALGACPSAPPDSVLLRSASALDTAWVLRWLDDVGLPQHKDAFLAARVDGPVLHRLSLEDLVALHITSSLHAASLRRGIQILRERQFEPNCLRRRSTPEERNPPTADEVSLWTNHRVMEWLRAVDLAEYAPNMRGSGVHGALMVHESKFTAELLASLLAIPPHKTLLRRHLSTHFQELVGRDKIVEKRQAEAQPGYLPLTATAKLKLTKRSQFTLKRKKLRAEMELEDLVCPLDTSGSDSGDRPVLADDHREPPADEAVSLGNSINCTGANRTSNV